MTIETFVIALEGGVCAGKSTVAKILKESLSAIACPDYMSFLSEEENSELEKIRAEGAPAFDFFLRLEARRWAASKSEGIIIQDRSVLTLLAHEFALIKMGISKIANMELALNKYCPEQHINMVFFLSVSDKEREFRKNSRIIDSGDILYLKEFNAWFEMFFRCLEGDVPIKFIKCDGLSPSEIASCIKNFIDSSSVKKPLSEYTSILKVFRHD